jgi:endonuclease/exonuclease/phosphatase family metal-dependent hydrolase
MLSIASYNILHGKKLDKIILWLLANTFAFDIICFQEFPEEKTNEFLQQVPKHFQYKFAIGFTRGKQHFGELTLYNSRKLSIEDSQTVLLGTGFLEKRLRRDTTERSSLLTMFLYKNKKFLLANTHLVALALNGRRKKQLEELLKKIKRIPNAENLPMVLLGDFNYSSRFRQKKLFEFMEKNSFINAYKKPTHRLFLVNQQLDYVFYKLCNVKNIFITKLAFSDHHLITFQLAL